MSQLEGYKKPHRQLKLSMMALRSSVLLFCSINLALGLILPGPCPLLRPSDVLSHETFSLTSIVATVPFAARKSSMFPDIYLENVPHCHSVDYHNSSKTFDIDYNCSQCARSNDCHFNFVNRNVSMAATATYIFDAENLNTWAEGNCWHFQENIRVWFVNEEGVIIWSCEEVNYGEDHDEAVLLADSYVGEDDDEYGEKVKNLKVIAAKYLKEPLLQSIIWPKALKKGICMDEPMCVKGSNCMDEDNFEYKWIVFISLLVVMGFYIIYRIGILFSEIFREIKQKRIVARRWAW